MRSPRAHPVKKTGLAPSRSVSECRTSRRLPVLRIRLVTGLQDQTAPSLMGHTGQRKRRLGPAFQTDDAKVAKSASRRRTRKLDSSVACEARFSLLSRRVQRSSPASGGGLQRRLGNLAAHPRPRCQRLSPGWCSFAEGRGVRQQTWQPCLGPPGLQRADLATSEGFGPWPMRRLGNFRLFLLSFLSLAASDPVRNRPQACRGAPYRRI